MGVLLHLTGVGSEVLVGLLDLLGGLLTEGKESTVLGGHGILDGVDSVALVGGDLGRERSASSGRGLGRLVVGAVEGRELGLGPLNLLLKVILGDLGGRLDGEKNLLLHLGASGLGLEVELCDLTVDVLGQGTDLGGDTVVELSTGLLVEGLGLLLEVESALLTLVDGITDGVLELGVVSLGDVTELLAASGGLDGVGSLDTSEVLDVAVVLTLEALHGLVKASDTGSEARLGRAEGSGGVEAGTSGGSGETLVGGSLGLGVLGKGAEESTGLAGEATLGVSTVALHLLADLGDLGVEAVGHLLHAGGGLSLVLVHETTELLVLLEVLLVTSVTGLDHALDLSVHLTVHLGLLELVVLDDTSEPGDTVVELLGLMVDHSRELEDTDLEIGDSLVHTGLGLGLGGGDVSHSLGETLVLESLVGVEGGVHAGGGVLEHHVSVGTVLGHGSADLTELSRGLSGDLLNAVVGVLAELLVLGNHLGSKLGAALLGLLTDVVDLVIKTVHGLVEVLAGLLGVLLNLGSVGRDGLVGLTNLSVRGRREGGQGTLVSGGGHPQVVCGLLLVLAHDSTLGNEGIVCHLGQEHLFHLRAGECVGSKVLGHLGAHCGNISLAPGNLLGNVGLNLVKEGKEALTTIGGLGDEHASLLDIHALDGAGSVPVETGADVMIDLVLEDSLLEGLTVGGDVHHRAAYGKAAEKSEGNTAFSFHYCLLCGQSQSPM